MPETIPFSMRLDADLKDQLEAAAARDRRSTASLINVILQRWLDGALYEVEPGTVKALPVVGRPRVAKQHGSTKHPLTTAILPWLGERTSVTLDEVLEGPLKCTRATAQPFMDRQIKDFFHELGWRETFIHSKNGTTSAWLKPSTL